MMARLRLDALDRKIIAELQINSRLSVQDLAERVGLSASPCARRIRILSSVWNDAFDLDGVPPAGGTTAPRNPPSQHL